MINSLWKNTPDCFVIYGLARDENPTDESQSTLSNEFRLQELEQEIARLKAFLEALSVYGFSRKGRANIEDYEVREYKKSAKIILKYSDEELAKFIKNGVFQTVSYHEKDQAI